MCAGLVNLMWTVLAFQPGRGLAWHGLVRQGLAWQARRGLAGQGGAWLGKARQGAAGTEIRSLRGKVTDRI